MGSRSTPGASGTRRDLLSFRDHGPDLDEMATIRGRVAPDSRAAAVPIGAVYGAIIALAGWRFARRFAWRGLAAFVIVLSIGGPIRERLYLSAAHLAVMAPGAVPWMANTLSWACALLLSHSIMRLSAGTP